MVRTGNQWWVHLNILTARVFTVIHQLNFRQFRFGAEPESVLLFTCLLWMCDMWLYRPCHFKLSFSEACLQIFAYSIRLQEVGGLNILDQMSSLKKRNRQDHTSSSSLSFSWEKSVIISWKSWHSCCKCVNFSRMMNSETEVKIYYSSFVFRCSRLPLGLKTPKWQNTCSIVVVWLVSSVLLIRCCTTLHSFINPQLITVNKWWWHELTQVCPEETLVH